MKISVVGTGYVGLVTGACLADTGNDVVGMDIDASKIDRLKKGECPLFEPGLAELVRDNQHAGRLSFTTDITEAVHHGDVIFLAIGTPPEMAETMRCYAAVGCSTCSGTGYKGRIALYEVMPMADTIRNAVLAGSSNDEIKREAIQAGMQSLRQSGIQKIADGFTSVDEVLRITMPD